MTNFPACFARKIYRNGLVFFFLAIDEPVVGIPKIKRNKGKWNKSWKKSKTKKPSTTLSIQEEIEIVKNNDPDEEKGLRFSFFEKFYAPFLIFF